MPSEEQWDYVGDCEDCGSPIYQLTQGPFKGQFHSKNPAPDCNCWIKEEDAEEKEGEDVHYQIT